MNLITASSLNKTYGTHRALQDFSMQLPEGQITGLLGPNGAGKTTLIRLITRILHPDNGSITYKGLPLTDWHQEHMGYLPEERGLYRKMQVLEQLVFFGTLKGLSQKDARARSLDWLEQLDLEDAAKKNVEQLSKGQQQKIQFIAAVLHRPSLLILDEPFTGLDPVNLELLRDRILDLKKNGTTILFSTHRMESVEELCERIILVNHGKKIIEDTTPNILQQFSSSSWSVTHSATHLPQGQTFSILLQEHGKALIHPSGENFQVIEELNSLTGLISFTPVQARMQDIFVQLVKPTEA